jgi:hypothetical protein
MDEREPLSVGNICCQKCAYGRIFWYMLLFNMLTTPKAVCIYHADAMFMPFALRIPQICTLHDLNTFLSA